MPRLTVIGIDPSRNPLVEAEAADRFRDHRPMLGKTRPHGEANAFQPRQPVLNRLLPRHRHQQSPFECSAAYKFK